MHVRSKRKESAKGEIDVSRTSKTLIKSIIKYRICFAIGSRKCILQKCIQGQEDGGHWSAANLEERPFLE